MGEKTIQEYQMALDIRDNIKTQLDKANKKVEKLEKEFKGKNPMHYCLNCDKYLGHRGFCSQKCHDKWYDEELFHQRL